MVDLPLLHGYSQIWIFYFNETQQKSSEMTTAYVQGDPSVSLSQVMIQSQKSSVSFQALTQVRNKVVQAYEDIMKMPV